MMLGALQPGYLPWLGFFDQIARCDVFILYDDLPYAGDKWRNRNRIKVPQGWYWLTVPLVSKTLSKKVLREIEVSAHGDWQRHHWRTIENHYAQAAYFHMYAEFFARVYTKTWRFLVDLDLEIIFYLIKALGIETKILIASDHGLEQEYQRIHRGCKDPTARVAFLCQRLGAERFLEGALGRTFMDPSRLAPLGITLDFHDYHHPSYHQLFEGFIPYLSVIDLLFNHGPGSLDILTGRKTVYP